MGWMRQVWPARPTEAGGAQALRPDARDLDGEVQAGRRRRADHGPVGAPSAVTSAAPPASWAARTRSGAVRSAGARGGLGELALHGDRAALVGLLGLLLEQPGGQPADGHERGAAGHLEEVDLLLAAGPLEGGRHDGVGQPGAEADGGDARRPQPGDVPLPLVSHPSARRPVVSRTSPPSRNGLGSASSLVATQRTGASGRGHDHPAQRQRRLGQHVLDCDHG